MLDIFYTWWKQNNKYCEQKQYLEIHSSVVRTKWNWAPSKKEAQGKTLVSNSLNKVNKILQRKDKKHIKIITHKNVKNTTIKKTLNL